jgi:hypothetical protein
MTTKRLSINDMVDGILDINDIELDSMIGSLGIKAHIGELISQKIDDVVERTMIQFYVECSVPSHPSDVSLGYMSSDVITRRGICVVDVNGETDPPRYIGEAYDPDVFINQFIVDDSIKHDVRAMMEQLLIKAFPHNDWLEKISSLYNNRVVGQSWINNEMRMC